MQKANDKDYIIINMSKVSHNSLKYKNYEYKPEIPIANDIINFDNSNSNNSSNNSNSSSNKNNFGNSLNFMVFINYLKSYFIKKKELDEAHNV